MDVVNFIVYLYNVRSVRICAKSVGILFLIIWHLGSNLVFRD